MKKLLIKLLLRLIDNRKDWTVFPTVDDTPCYPETLMELPRLSGDQKTSASIVIDLYPDKTVVCQRGPKFHPNGETFVVPSPLVKISGWFVGPRQGEITWAMNESDTGVESEE